MSKILAGCTSCSLGLEVTTGYITGEDTPTNLQICSIPLGFEFVFALYWGDEDIHWDDNFLILSEQHSNTPSAPWYTPVDPSGPQPGQ